MGRRSPAIGASRRPAAVNLLDHVDIARVTASTSVENEGEPAHPDFSDHEFAHEPESTTGVRDPLQNVGHEPRPVLRCAVHPAARGAGRVVGVIVTDEERGVVVQRRGISLGGLIYIIIGVVVALSNGYGITGISTLISFLLAMFLWPLVLLGVDLHLQFG
jgi:hypothetical protein